ncbi:TolC family protein [Luteimonas granuli]|uniref:TolC family protein n=1 Tax=Luteimonas granuli TaxID=1176533 RepID=A0A518N159_9GAMM|nr:TolC family protein [Luteimonas granuli]QDW65660.1 TolC family protein [Luteimonas granuli]
MASKLLQRRACAPPSSIRTSWRRLAVAVLLLSGIPAAAAAEQALPGHDVTSVHGWLREHNPELRALQAGSDAAFARIHPAGALPDPVASLSFRNLDPDRPWQVPGDDREIGYTLRQHVPLWGKRGLARTAARQDAEALALDRDAVLREIIAEAEAAYVRYWHADQAVAVLDRRLDLLRRLEEVAGVRYALGIAPQQDSIRAQVEQTVMRRERIRRLVDKEEAAAALNGVLGRPVDAALAPSAEDPILAVRSASLADVLRALESGSHPAVQAEEARALAARTNVELQRRRRYPDVTFGVGAMRREDGLESLELMLEVEIPFQQRTRRERERESRLLEEAALARTDVARQALARQGAAAWVQWQGARERRLITERTLLPQADAAFQSALASYQVGEVDFGTLLEALDQWQGADLDRVDALRDELLGAAAVRAIEGEAR